VTNKSKTSLDYTNAITSAHNEAENAFNVITANSLLPANFGKFDLTYINGPSGSRLISQVDYYSIGSYEKTRIIFNSDLVGTAHKTTLNFINKTPAMLAGKGFVIHDELGPVLVWFNVDFNNTAPSAPGTYRDISVNLLSGHTSTLIAQKTALALSIDPKFLAVYSITYVIISSTTVGTKPNSYDLDSGVPVKNTAGKDSNSLNSKYILLNSANNANSYYIWYNVNGAGVDPLVPGKTGLMVAIPAGSEASAIAQATKIVVDATGKFITNVNGESLHVRNKTIGTTTSASIGTSDVYILIEEEGFDREYLTTILIGYDSYGNINSVEKV
jgi:hypothetical protein